MQIVTKRQSVYPRQVSARASVLCVGMLTLQFSPFFAGSINYDLMVIKVQR